LDQASKTRRFHLTGVHTEGICSFDVKENKLVATGGTCAAVWDLSNGELSEKYTCKEGKLFFTVVINDEMIASGGLGGIIWLFNRKTG